MLAERPGVYPFTRRDRGWECVQEEEEGEYEYASYHHGGESGKEEAHVEPAILYQPLPEESGEASEGSGGTMTPVKGGAECFSRSGCARKDRALRHGSSGNSWEEYGDAACAFYGPFIPGAAIPCGGLAVWQVVHH
jgi:hypothetical protein